MSAARCDKAIQSDIKAIKGQLEALVCESRLKRLGTVTFLLELACAEVGDVTISAIPQVTVSETPVTIQ